MSNFIACSIAASCPLWLYNDITPFLCEAVKLNLSIPINWSSVGSLFPSKFSLSQNYPNPFNPNTKINFDIPEDGMVVLKVYDINGREVQTLVNEFRKAGYYSKEFNAGNLSSGSYFVKLESGNEMVSTKMMLVK